MDSEDLFSNLTTIHTITDKLGSGEPNNYLFEIAAIMILDKARVAGSKS